KLTPQERAAIIHETFEAISTVGFTKWQAEELMGYGYLAGQEDKEYYFRNFKEAAFADFEKMSAASSDERVLDARQFWIEKAKAMTLTEWQVAQGREGGAQQWYEEMGQEISAVSVVQGWNEQEQQRLESVGVGESTHGIPHMRPEDRQTLIRGLFEAI